MSTPGQEFVEIFLQEASEHLQFLREYSGILQDPYPHPEDVERLHISAHTLGGTSASYGYPLFSEVAGKLAHIFQYAMNATISPDASGPLVEFISEGVAVLESDLIMISANSVEAEEEISSFKAKYPFAFQAPAPPPEPEIAPVYIAEHSATDEGFGISTAPHLEQPLAEPRAIHLEPLPADSEGPEEILEFFVPEAEEHLQIVQECLLALEANPNSEDINRLFRAIHTVKGSAAQVGLQRIARVAHRAEDLIGRLRDGALRPSAEIIDICLESVDALKKFLYRQWPDESTLHSATHSLLTRIARLAPEESEESEAMPAEAVATAAHQAAEVTPAELAEEAQAVAEPVEEIAIVAAASTAQGIQRSLVPAVVDDEAVLPGKKELAA